MKKNQSIAILVLEDGSIFRGQSVGYKGVACGEVVFNTSMSGYQEILSDPSYSGQMVTLTYPHIGNVGANDEDMESAKLFAQALIIKDLPRLHSNWRSTSSLGEFLEHHQCVAIAGIDTRQLTRLIREKGAQNGCIMCVDDGDDMEEAIKQALSNAKAQDSMQGQDLAIKVSTKKSYQWREPTWDIEGDKKTAAVKYNVAAYDYGVKHNILRLLVDHGCAVTVYPADTPASDILSKDYDGVFLSNGPGDPEPCDYAITAIKEILDADKPLFGICLGHQLLSLAVGAKTHKMKFGHHGANHPVIDLDSQQVLITSQNHGFAVDQDNMPSNVRVTHRSLFDQTVQGIEVTDKAAFSFQGHPEASPGPHDIQYLFARFCQLMDTHKAQV